MTPPRLVGPRVVLRPLAPADRPAIARILSEPSVARWWLHGDLEAAVDELFEDALGDPATVGLAIEVGGEIAGYVEFSEEQTPDYRHAGIDLFVATDWQGRGIGPEAIRLVARHLFEERGHHRLTIDPAAANERAIQAYEKVGFRPVGLMRQYERGLDGTWHDGLLMDLVAGELLDEL